jgi:hypothetical protein
MVLSEVRVPTRKIENGRLMEWHIRKVAICQGGNFIKWQVDQMTWHYHGVIQGECAD